MFSICPGVILSEPNNSLRSNSLGTFDKLFRDCFFSVFSIVTKLQLAPYIKPISIKKAEGHLPSPQERESKPYTHKQETPPAYSREHLSVSLCVWNNFDFSPAQKSAKRFFSSICKNTVGLRPHKYNNLPS